MRLLPPLVLALSGLAVPANNKRDILGLLPGESVASTRTVPHSLKPSSTNPSVKPTRAQSSIGHPSPLANSTRPTSLKTAPLASSSLILPASAESHSTDHSSKAWQIVGIVIIAVLFIATSITCALFFDRLWRLLKDVVCCTSRPPVAEEFVPDYEKQSCYTRTRSPSLSDRNQSKPESLHEAVSVYNMRQRELPWNTQDGNTLHRHPSRRNDHPPPA